MQMPALSDTIVAVSSGWQPTPVGIIRLSGAESFALVRGLGATTTSDRPQWSETRLRLDADCVLPATVFCFPSPRSYTGQDVVEIHTVGCLPLLRELSTKLIEAGARRALPGEFTARALMTGRLDTRQVEGVLALMQSEDEAAVRQGARLVRESRVRFAADLAERITGLLALIEAGIDFVEEEDIRFVSPAEVVQTLDALLAAIAAATDIAGERRAGKPHVALVGPPNAGKSTLFNALLGSERALVSPVLGTTRDVLSAEIELDGHAIVLQDCAGLGSGADEIELAAHLAAERTAQQADLVLWIHAADSDWQAGEIESCRRVAPERRMLVWTKTDLGTSRSGDDPVGAFAGVLHVCAITGTGLAALRARLAKCLDTTPVGTTDSAPGAELHAASAALSRARALAGHADMELASPELIALELRTACDLLIEDTNDPLDEAIMSRVFSEFCVGK